MRSLRMGVVGGVELFIRAGLRVSFLPITQPARLIYSATATALGQPIDAYLGPTQPPNQRMDHDENAREIAAHATQVLAGQWVRAAITIMPSIPLASRGRTDFCRTLLRDFARLRDTHAPHVIFMHFLRALGNDIARRTCELRPALCELFTYVMKQYPDRDAYGEFDFSNYVSRPRVG